GPVAGDPDIIRVRGLDDDFALGRGWSLGDDDFSGSFDDKRTRMINETAAHDATSERREGAGGQNRDGSDKLVHNLTHPLDDRAVGLLHAPRLGIIWAGLREAGQTRDGRVCWRGRRRRDKR